MKHIGILWCLLLCNCLSCQSPRDSDFVPTDGITSDFHRLHAGEILFSAEPTEGREYNTPEEIALSPFGELHFTMLLETSLTNYLHQLAPTASLTELDTSGNYQFSFFVDGTNIYTDNLHPGAPYAEEKHRQTRLDKPLVSYPFSDWWSAYLWNRFLRNGGQAALSPGKHKLNLEIRPYLARKEVLVGDIIAAGAVILDIIPPSVKGINIDSIPVSKPSSYKGLSVSAKHPIAQPLQELRAKIEAKVYKDITSIVVLKQDSILVEEYYNGSNRDSRHDVRSVGKTFASTILGMAIADSHLRSEKQQLGEFYQLSDFAHYDARKETITLSDLMTMSSAFEGNDSDPASPGNEELMYPTDDWVRFALDLPLKPLAEQQWQYFTAGVVVLGDVLHQNVPGGLEAYAESKLFTPLGISSQLWQHTPQGVANTAGGIRMTSLDFAKYGQLYANKGRWNGQQILPEDWVDKSFTRHLAITDRPEEYYGYLFWNKTYSAGNRELETYYCAGNGGNKIFVFPEDNLVVVVTATAYGQPYAHPQVDEIMEQYLLPSVLGAQ